MKSLRRLATWLACSAFALTLIPAAAQTGQPLKIGVIGPFTGPSSDFGTPMRHGIELAVEEINAVGGYLGRPLQLVIKDDEGTPDVGRQRSEELVKEGVVATIGFCNTGVAMRSLEVFQQAQLPLIVPCSTGTPLTSTYPAPESYIFRTSARDAIQAPFVVDDLVRRGWTRVAIFADTTGYGEAGLKDVEAALAAKNLKPAFVARFPLGVKDLRKELQAAREAGANVVFSYTVGPENATIALGRRDLGWNVPQVGAWPLSFPFFIDGAGAAAEGALMAQTFIAEPSNERRAAFLSAYARKFKQPLKVPMAAAQAYDTTYLLTYALFGIRDGRFTGPAVKLALENIPRVYYGVVATHERPFSRDDKDAISQNMLVMGRVSKGAITFAYPEDARRNLLVQRKR
ncbi:MAG TPA: ABC transporter substrate-binding protein [Hydrogenophaga sp.]|uniref:ABC transporter substrate-binding protein n=1 Tax=Hydrogenophaga sp. TaxID=1904254 RepID=UPI002C4934EF|nr:ABC transporter substrate-binding protein [Hydrogenophaga sp.]HMN93298.1 ABC transporter substrate-binding protein [Hydrogenophaga sp.]HMP11913.1 ABC transporter substrate-binding protein [Hydrogenophaga sp.]